MPEPSDYAIKFCPRCDRSFQSFKGAADALEKVKKHVEKGHPDYDPDWWKEAEK